MVVYYLVSQAQALFMRKPAIRVDLFIQSRTDVRIVPSEHDINHDV